MIFAALYHSIARVAHASHINSHTSGEGAAARHLARGMASVQCVSGLFGPVLSRSM